MSRVLLLASTTGYQTRAFGEAAARLDVELVLATDRCHALENPWRDDAVAIRFHEPDAAVAAILTAAAARPLDGVLPVGDRPVLIAARVADALGLPWHPPDGAAAASNKQATRERLAAAGLPASRTFVVPLDTPADAALRHTAFPCVVKPLALSGSRGVIRADDPAAFRAAFERVRRLLLSTDVRAMRDPANEAMVIQGFIPGREFAVEAIMEHGRFHPLAVFDKPDRLDGPFFEETIYVTPSREAEDQQSAIFGAVAAAARALGLRHGPVHAECRVNEDGVFVLEAAARPIGGLCARALRFTRTDGTGPVPLEELLLRTSLGEPPSAWIREVPASGVMMIPIPGEGIYRGVEGLAEAGLVSGITEVSLTARPDQRLVPLPEGGSYLGFIFARAASPFVVETALRQAHRTLRFRVDARVPTT